MGQTPVFAYFVQPFQGFDAVITIVPEFRSGLFMLNPFRIVIVAT